MTSTCSPSAKLPLEHTPNTTWKFFFSDTFLYQLVFLARHFPLPGLQVEHDLMRAHCL